MSERLNDVDPVPSSAYPSLQPVTTPHPAMPRAWAGVALLHPFAPPLLKDPKPDSPFFQLCVANIAYAEGLFLSAQIAGCSYGMWWYVITPAGTELSKDKGASWTKVDMGWTLPSNWFADQISKATCAGSSELNWMAAQRVEWWKVPVPSPVPPVPSPEPPVLFRPSPPAATWMWFDSASHHPVRMMFGSGPPLPTKGDPTQLALFQMFSFTYFPTFTELDSLARPAKWTDPTFPGFAVGNPNGYKKFVWNGNFGMTVFMTPVNENFNPLPTRVLYVWKPDSAYSVASDRAQSTLMQYRYNDGSIASVEALLFGAAPKGVPPPVGSDIAFLITEYRNDTKGPFISPTCVGGSRFPFPQEPPNWVSIPAVHGTIQATITDNSVVCPGVTVAVYSVLFPPAPPNYPEATYLWAWFNPVEGSDGSRGRLVTFMQSQSGVNKGTSLALADYFYYQEFTTPIDPSNFAVPAACAGQM